MACLRVRVQSCVQNYQAEMNQISHLDASLGQTDFLRQSLARKHVRVMGALEFCNGTPSIIKVSMFVSWV